MSITPLPTPPSREDPNNFAARADQLLAALVTFVSECNATAGVMATQSSAATESAATATTKAGEAASARDIAMAAVNYKGLWSSLSGALAVPASAYHSSKLWLLLENVASVSAEVPGVSAKWLDVTPASGLGSAAYQSSSAFQPAIGALTGLLRSDGDGIISAATADQIVADIGALAVAEAEHAASADEADTATNIADEAVSAASKISNGIITWAKMVAMGTGKLIGRSSGGGGSPEEISIGAGLGLTGGELRNTGARSFNTRTGDVQLNSGDVTTALGFTPSAAGHTHSYADLTAIVGATYIGPAGAGTQSIRFTRANGATFDVVSYVTAGVGGGG